MHGGLLFKYSTKLREISNEKESLHGAYRFIKITFNCHLSPGHQPIIQGRRKDMEGGAAEKLNV